MSSKTTSDRLTHAFRGRGAARYVLLLLVLPAALACLTGLAAAAELVESDYYWRGKRITCRKLRPGVLLTRKSADSGKKRIRWIGLKRLFPKSKRNKRQLRKVYQAARAACQKACLPSPTPSASPTVSGTPHPIPTMPGTSPSPEPSGTPDPNATPTPEPTLAGNLYYVADPRGADGRSGTADDINSSDSYSGAIDAPFATIAKASSIAAPGDIISIRGGEYNEILRPLTSGSANGPITYRNYNGEDVLITDPPSLSDVPPGEDPDHNGDIVGMYLYGIEHVTVEGLHFDNISRWARINHSKYITLKNNRFTRATGTGSTGGVKVLYSQYCRIINNILQDGNDNIVFVHTHNSLIAENQITEGRHTLWCIRAGNFNIVRGNYFYNSQQKIGEVYDNEHSSDPPVVYDATKHNLIDNNAFAYTPPSVGAAQYSGIQYAGQNGIVRRNLFYDNTGIGLDLTLYSDEARYTTGNRVYNNIFYKNHFGGIGLAKSASYSFYDNLFKNNILYKNDFIDHDGRYDDWASFDGSPVQVWNLRSNGFYFDGNNIHNEPGYEDYAIGHGDGPTFHSLAWWESGHPDRFHGNRIADPGFIDAENHDFRLKAGSSMIDSGVFLTTAASSGSGTVLTVADASYFSDGFNIPGIAGDYIQLKGQTDTARIVSINYESNTLTLARSLSWTAGQEVALAFAGEAPDLGAFEAAAQ